MAKVKGVNSIAAAKAKGASLNAINQVTFAAPVFVATSGASEPAISGAVAATPKESSAHRLSKVMPEYISSKLSIR